jgi:predicted DCC family thiol-disulfide oxidoreductase YuxK
MVMRLVGGLTTILVGVAALELLATILGRSATRSRIAPGRALLVYDDGCGLCSRAARFVSRRAVEQLELVPFSGLPHTGILEQLSQRELRASAHFVSFDGVEYHGGESVTRAARLLPGGGAVALLDRPLLRGLREIVYRLVAWQRDRISRWLSSRSGVSI